eukprot:1147432-Pelagomonas_calceolata.AAC.9
MRKVHASITGGRKRACSFPSTLFAFYFRPSWFPSASSPGVPLLFPGEVITRNALEALLSAAVSGTVAGASDPTLEYITVISEPAD